MVLGMLSPAEHLLTLFCMTMSDGQMLTCPSSSLLHVVAVTCSQMPRNALPDGRCQELPKCSQLVNLVNTLAHVVLMYDLLTGLRPHNVLMYGVLLGLHQSRSPQGGHATLGAAGAARGAAPLS